VNFLSRSSLATRPETRVPTGSFASLIKNCGVVVEADVRAILAARFLAHADDDALHDFAFLDLAFRCRFLDRSGDDVAESRFQSGIARLA